jgi:hypothetical protein
MQEGSENLTSSQGVFDCQEMLFGHLGLRQATEQSTPPTLFEQEAEPETVAPKCVMNWNIENV